MAQVLYSLTAFFEGFAFTLKRPHLYRYIALAILFNFIALGIVFFSLLLAYWIIINQIFTLFSVDLPAVIEVSLGVIGIILSGFLLVVLFGTVSGVANSIIYGKLTDAVLDELLIDDQRSKMHYLGPMADLSASISFELKKLALSLVLILISFLLGIIPLVGVFLSMIVSIISLVVFNGLDAYEPQSDPR